MVAREAKQLVRQLKRDQPARKTPIVVAIRNGNYFLPEQVRFTPEDSGSEQARLSTGPMVTSGRSSAVGG